MAARGNCYIIWSDVCDLMPADGISEADLDLPAINVELLTNGEGFPVSETNVEPVLVFTSVLGAPRIPTFTNTRRVALLPLNEFLEQHNRYIINPSVACHDLLRDGQLGDVAGCR